MKVEITKAQLEALIEMTDEFSASIGMGEPEDDKIRNHCVKMADRFFNKNGFKRHFN